MFKVCISGNFCIKVIKLRREDKDQDMLLIKKSIFLMLLKSRFSPCFTFVTTGWEREVVSYAARLRLTVICLCNLLNSTNLHKI
jgi:hypothetical protein